MTDIHFIEHPTMGHRLVICPECLWTAAAPGQGTGRARQLLAAHDCPHNATCPGCARTVDPKDESYTRSGWHDSCAQTDVWANTPSGRRALDNATSTGISEGP